MALDARMLWRETPRADVVSKGSTLAGSSKRSAAQTRANATEGRATDDRSRGERQVRQTSDGRRASWPRY